MLNSRSEVILPHKPYLDRFCGGTYTHIAPVATTLSNARSNTIRSYDKYNERAKLISVIDICT